MKNIKALLGSLAIAAILGANGYMAMSGTKAQTELTLEGVERMAEGEIFDTDRKKGDFYTYECTITKTVLFDAEGRWQKPDGTYLYGKAYSSATRTYTFTAGNCGGSSDRYCKPIKCK